MAGFYARTRFARLLESQQVDEVQHAVMHLSLKLYLSFAGIYTQP